MNRRLFTQLLALGAGALPMFQAEAQEDEDSAEADGDGAARAGDRAKRPSKRLEKTEPMNGAPSESHVAERTDRIRSSGSAVSSGTPLLMMPAFSRAISFKVEPR